jgi:hypothetical protein
LVFGSQLIDSWIVDTILGRVDCPTLFSVAPVNKIPVPVDEFHRLETVFDFNEVPAVFFKVCRGSFDMFW